MKRCPHCQEEIPDEAVICEHCGKELDPKRADLLTNKNINDGNVFKSKRKWLVPTLIFGSIVLIAIAYLVTNTIITTQLINQKATAEAIRVATAEAIRVATEAKQSTQKAIEDEISTAKAKSTQSFIATETEKSRSLARAQSPATNTVPSFNGNVKYLLFFSKNGKTLRKGKEFQIGTFEALCTQLTFSINNKNREVDFLIEYLLPNGTLYNDQMIFTLNETWSEVWVESCVPSSIFKTGNYVVSVYDGTTKAAKGTFSVNK